MKNREIFLLALLISIIVLSQIIGKYGVSINNNSFFGIFLNIFVLSSYLLLLIRGIVWIKLLQDFDLSFLYPLLSFSFVLIPIFSFILFDEFFSMGKIIGSCVIVLGIYFCTLHATKPNKKIYCKE